jgi:signal transduction histidine kinase
MHRSTAPRPPSESPAPRRLSAPGAHLTARLATSLASAEPGEIDAELEHALQIVGRFLDVDIISRCPLGKDGRLRASQEWRTTGWMDPCFELDTRQAAWWMSRASFDEDIILDEVSAAGALGTYEREVLTARGTRSLLAVPYGERGVEHGYVVVETMREPRAWIPEEVTLLATFASTMSSALVRGRHHERLLESARQAETASTARSHFIAMLAHEVRTPLTAILGYAQMLETQLPAQAPPRAGELVRSILECTSHVTSLVTDTLDLARIDSGQMPLDVAEVDVREAIEGALVAVRPRAITEEVTLEWTPPAAEVRVRGDARKLRQLVINLLANAIKHSREGERVVITLDATGDQYAIAVEDNGPGIAPRDRARIFESFARGKHDDGEGAGLGLSLVHRLCELHGGQIELESEPGKGARFTARLPVRPPPAVGRAPYVAA